MTLEGFTPRMTQLKDSKMQVVSSIIHYDSKYINRKYFDKKGCSMTSCFSTMQDKNPGVNKTD